MWNYISPSLLNNWLYALQNDNIDNFIDYLERKPQQTTEAMLKGIEFEDEVYKGNKPLYNEYVKEGKYQVKVARPYKDIMILGIIDVLQPNWIYDIKTTSNYEIGKYGKTSQHLVYPYCTGIKNFAYLVNEECYKEDYVYQDGQLEKLVDDFINWLKISNYYKTWKKYWVKNVKGENYEIFK